MKWNIEITVEKIYSILVLALAFYATSEGMNDVATIAVAAGAGFYGWKNHEDRKILERKDAK